MSDRSENSGKSHSILAVAAIVCACLLWGTTGTAASFINDVSSLAIGAFAMGVSGLLMGLRHFSSLFKQRRKLRQCGWLIVLGGFSVVIYPLAFYRSMSLAGVAVGTVISIACAPFFSVLLEVLIDGKKVSQQWWLSFFIGCIGMVVLTLSKQSLPQQSSDQEYMWGIVLGLIAAFSYASYSWSAKSMIERGVSSGSAMAVMFLFASLWLLPGLLLSNVELFTSPINTAALLYLALIPMFVGYLAFAYGLAVVSASQATLITLLEPVIAAVLAVVIVGEQFLWTGWAGMALIIAGLLLPLINIGKAVPHQSVV